MDPFGIFLVGIITVLCVTILVYLVQAIIEAPAFAAKAVCALAGIYGVGWLVTKLVS